MIQTKLKISEQMLLVFLDDFHEIAGDKDSFTLQDFVAAKVRNPSLLAVLEDFDSVTSSTAKVDFIRVKQFRNEVVQTLHDTQNQIKHLCTHGDTATQLVAAIEERIETLNHQFSEFEPKAESPGTKIHRKQTVAGGNFLQMHNLNFDLIINILIGIRRTVANLAEVQGTALDDRHFRKKIVTENDWVSSNQDEERVVRFVDYAPLVF